MKAKSVTQTEPVWSEWDAATGALNDAEEAAVDARCTLMATPAPDLPALWWKIQQLLRVGAEGTTSVWMAADVQPVLDDCKRLLA